MKHKTFQIGTISEGTTKPRDILENILYHAEHFIEGSELIGNLVEVVKIDEDHEVGYSDMLDSAVEACAEYLPPYCYIGMAEGDGADFGVFVDTEQVQREISDGEILSVDDTSAVPDDYTGDVVQVSDHGNWTLYSAQNGALTEVWGIV